MAALGIQGPEAADRLAALQQDLAEARMKLRDVMDALALRHGIATRDVAHAIDGHADDMLSDAVRSVAGPLAREVKRRTGERP